MGMVKEERQLSVMPLALYIATKMEPNDVGFMHGAARSGAGRAHYHADTVRITPEVGLASDARHMLQFLEPFIESGAFVAIDKRNVGWRIAAR